MVIQANVSANRKNRPLSHHLSFEEEQVKKPPLTASNSSFIANDYSTFVKTKSEEYSRTIQRLQDDYLYPLKEDLSEWINKILGTPVSTDEEETHYLTPDNFLKKLDNGVIICKVAKVIESQCDLTDIVADRIKRELSSNISSRKLLLQQQQENFNRNHNRNGLNDDGKTNSNHNNKHLPSLVRNNNDYNSHNNNRTEIADGHDDGHNDGEDKSRTQLFKKKNVSLL